MNTIGCLIVSFQRHENLRQILNLVVGQNFHKIYIVIDNVSQEGQKRLDVHKLVVQTAIDFQSRFPDRISVRIRERNLGISVNFLLSVTECLTEVELLCVLEDDCIPSPSLFNYIEKLQPYCNRERFSLAALSRPNLSNLPDGYITTHCPMMWGWLIWKSSWKELLILLSEDGIPSRKLNLRDFLLKGFLYSGYINTITGRKDALDAVFAYVFFVRDLLVLLPDSNLISNIGTGPGATNTTLTSKLLHNNIESFNEDSFEERINLINRGQSNNLDWYLYREMAGLTIVRLMASYFKARVLNYRKQRILIDAIRDIVNKYAQHI